MRNKDKMILAYKPVDKSKNALMFFQEKVKSNSIWESSFSMQAMFEKNSADSNEWLINFSSKIQEESLPSIKQQPTELHQSTAMRVHEAKSWEQAIVDAHIVLRATSKEVNVKAEIDGSKMTNDGLAGVTYLLDICLKTLLEQIIEGGIYLKNVE